VSGFGCEPIGASTQVLPRCLLREGTPNERSSWATRYREIGPLRDVVFGRFPGAASSVRNGWGSNPVREHGVGVGRLTAAACPAAALKDWKADGAPAQRPSAARLEDLKAEPACKRATVKRAGTRNRPYNRCGVFEVRASA
jgi:hypothetical protein